MAALVWFVAIGGAVKTLIDLASRDSPHHPMGVVPPIGTALLLAILVAAVLCARRMAAALLTNMSVEQRRRLDPWRADYYAATGFALVFTAAFIGLATLGEGFALGADTIIAVLTSIVCIQPLTELATRRWLVFHIAAENSHTWITRTRPGTWILHHLKRLTH